MPVNIHGKQYITVAERLTEANADKEFTLTRVITEVLQHQPVVVVKATVELENSSARKVFTGISSANPAKAIEKSNPYEVAETSAVGRALGFAGYGIVEGIASADEMVKSANEEHTKEITREPIKEACDHSSGYVEKIAHTPQNLGRTFKTCKSCNAFLGWVDKKPEVKEDLPEEPSKYEKDIVDF